MNNIIFSFRTLAVRNVRRIERKSDVNIYSFFIGQKYVTWNILESFLWNQPEFSFKSCMLPIFLIQPVIPTVNYASQLGCSVNFAGIIIQMTFFSSQDQIKRSSVMLIYECMFLVRRISFKVDYIYDCFIFTGHDFYISEYPINN